MQSTGMKAAVRLGLFGILGVHVIPSRCSRYNLGDADLSLLFELEVH